MSTPSSDPRIAGLRAALAQHPDAIEALSQLVDLHVARLEWDEAIAACDRALAHAPEHVGAKYKKSFVLAMRGDLEPAADLMHEVVVAMPTYAPAWRNLGAIATWRNDMAGAVQSYRRALSLQADDMDAEAGMAQAMLAMRDFGNGWEHYEARALGVHALAKRGAIPAPWRGQALSGALIVHGEGGFGDVIQFARLAALARRRVGRLVLFLRDYYAPLVEVLSTLEGVDAIASDREAFRDAQAAISVMSLPYALGRLPLDVAPTPVPYLRSDPQRRERWRARLAPDRGLRVGLVWAGDPRSNLLEHRTMDRRRSIALSALRPLLDVAGVSWHSLQKGEAAKELAGFEGRTSIVDHAHELGDFADTAALVDELDLVVSVDTAVVHLAGALGKPVWLLNRFDSCWRWGTSGERAAWYPAMRIFRQVRFGAWEPVIHHVANKLGQRVQHRRASSGP